MDDVRLCSSVGRPAPLLGCRRPARGSGRGRAYFCRWLAASAPLLAECRGVPGLEVTGREVAVGEQVFVTFDRRAALPVGRRGAAGPHRRGTRTARRSSSRPSSAMPTTTTWESW